MQPFRRKVDNPFIRDMENPSCVECMYYQAESTSILNKCTKFGGKDLHTGDIVFDYVDSVRYDESKCGKAGHYFKLDSHKTFKQMVRHLFPWAIIIPLLFQML
jgi:hypothetical protein